MKWLSARTHSWKARLPFADDDEVEPHARRHNLSFERTENSHEGLIFSTAKPKEEGGWVKKILVNYT